MKKTVLYFLFAFSMLPQLLQAQNNALDFDGFNDYISCGNVDLYNHAFTYETWFKVNNFQGNDPYLSTLMGIETGNDASVLRIIKNGNDYKLDFYMNSGNGGYYLLGTSPLVTNKWYHVALVFDQGSNEIRLYLNGMFESSISVASFTDNYTHNSFFISYSYDGRYLDGQMDEVRVWDYARSESQIRDYMYQELVGDEGGLLINYNFNETSGTTLTDNSSATITNNVSSLPGTLTNMDNTDWVTSPAFYGPKNCLDFDGVDENVYIGSFLPIVTSGTISFWIYLDAIPGNDARLISKSPNSLAGDEIYLTSGEGKIKTVGSFVVGDDLVSSNALSVGVWTHVSITADGTGSKLYINGILDDTGGAAAFSFDTFRIGGQHNTSFWETVNAKMDEVRVWSTVRTAEEIREHMYKTLVGNESGLVAYYNFDNASGNVLYDFSGNNDGTIENIENTDWVTSTAFNTWLDTDSSTWGTASNWSSGSVPSTTDNVGISNNGGTAPSLSSDLTVKSLSVETGASLTIASSTLTIANNIFNSGTLTATGTLTYAASTLYNNGTFINNGTTSLYDFTNNTGATATIASGNQLTVTNTISNSGTITVDGTFINNQTLTNSGTFTNEGATTLNNLTNTGTFNINSTATTNGSLIVSGTSTGNITYNRYLLGSKWHLFSAPIGAQNINSFVTNGANNVPRSDGGTGTKYALAPYDNTGTIGATTWDYYTIGGSNEASSAGNFIAGKGYQVYTTAAGTIAFTGTVPTAQTDLAVTVDASNTWNLVGNPFPSSIPANVDADATNNFLTVNASELDPSNTAIYIWDAATSAYVLVNHDSPATYIAPGQSFFVKSSAANTLNFTTAMRMHQPTAVFQKGNGNLKPTIQLIAENTEGKTSTTKIKYVSGTSYGLDPGYDASTFSAVESSFFGVYSKLIEDNGVNFSLQIVPDENYETTVIPIGITTDVTAEVTFKAVYENLPTDTKVFLEDRLLSVFTEINESNKSYTISLTSESSKEGRFYIHTLAKKPTEPSTELTDLRIVSYYDTNSLKVIGNLEETSTIEIFDTLGRFIFKSTISNEAHEISVPSMAKGIYYVKINSPTKKSSTKIAWY
ncbi:MAG: T9SS type A sorting domain-containing protein [Lutibacter sp.]|uniref:LamG-like jellyroll fold domain-containing protein n=1 Tax=Lutibacter sp. TaxID=1925666 RepID=UPI0019F41F97|nr:LamG-like jellyroll fold domain-containing protein [Lutibacter sp.]NOR28457.1 T9SS type A sorting domain-containing protein [Lutibacter sp.]